MPSLRAGVDRLPPYVAGRPIEEVAEEFGFDPSSVVKLASNESPLPPFPEVVEAIAAHAGTLNRYPDNGWHDVARAVGHWLDVDERNLMFAGGSSELLRVFALAVGGAGTSAVYAWPSFIIYRLASVLAGSETIEVPLSADHKLDPEGLVKAIRSDSTILYLCNPNNPTGSYLGSDQIKEVIDRVEDSVLVTIDEAYFDYVTAPDFASAIPEALARPNVVVTRTFSKVFGLAGLRIGYAIGQEATLLELRRAQAPFTVSTLGMAAAIEAVRHPNRIRERVEANQIGRNLLASELSRRQIEYVPSQTNFVYFRPTPGANLEEDFLRRGVIVRPFGEDWLRVTIGTPEEMNRFLSELDSILA
ncbi:MAG TPA: histidinol-phosphate transaminase [Acidimicrobiia bacterium]|nr:histidinol-phosphate transaminase [Acidimicrobiia bacterium]